MILFRDRGPMLFRDAIEKALRDPSSNSKWYLSVIDDLAQSMPVWTCSVEGLQWCEVDYPADLKLAEGVVAACDGSRQGRGDEGTCRVTQVNLL